MESLKLIFILMLTMVMVEGGKKSRKLEAALQCANQTRPCEIEDSCTYAFVLPSKEGTTCEGLKQTITTIHQSGIEECAIKLEEHEMKLAVLIEFKNENEYQQRKQLRRLQRGQGQWEEELRRHQQMIDDQNKEIMLLRSNDVKQQKELDRQNMKISELEEIVNNIKSSPGVVYAGPQPTVPAPVQRSTTVEQFSATTASFTTEPINDDIQLQKILDISSYVKSIRSFVSFEIDCVHYIATTDFNGTVIHTVGNTTLSFYQKIGGKPPDNVEFNTLDFFKIGEDKFLVLTNCDQGSHCIYKWVNGSFINFQTIVLDGILSWKIHYFNADTLIGTRHFLAIASYSKYDTRVYSYNYDISSAIYVWNGQLFVQFQTIPTSGARGVTSVVIGKRVYICFANSWSGKVWPRYNVQSEIFRLSLDGSYFSPYQKLPYAGGSSSVTAFYFTGNIYLMDILWQSADGSLLADSPLYIWDTTSEMFVSRQRIPTNNGRMLCTFTLKNQLYFIVVNSGNGLDDQVDSIVYVTMGTAGEFAEHQRVVTKSGKNCAVFQKDGMRNLLFLDNVIYSF
ncbi:uncharacterized protein LOC144344670 [Saccoglossus kowalevskii]